MKLLHYKQVSHPFALLGKVPQARQGYVKSGEQSLPASRRDTPQ